MYVVSFLASQDVGALLVHGPALLGAILVVTGLWPLWKYATGRRDALWAIVLAVAVVVLVILVIDGRFATGVVTRILPHETITHRMILRGGTSVAAGAAETGGPRLIEAIEQNWRMMNYAAEGGWSGRGYGGALVRGSRTFQNITLADLVFPVYVLAEHGALGGIALLTLYVLLFLVALRLA